MELEKALNNLEIEFIEDFGDCREEEFEELINKIDSVKNLEKHKEVINLRMPYRFSALYFNGKYDDEIKSIISDEIDNAIKLNKQAGNVEAIHQLYKSGGQIGTIEKIYNDLELLVNNKGKNELFQNLLRTHIEFNIVNRGLQKNGWIREKYLKNQNYNSDGRFFPIWYFFRKYSICDRYYISNPGTNKELKELKSERQNYIIDMAVRLGIWDFSKMKTVYLPLQERIYKINNSQIIEEYWDTLSQALFKVSNSIVFTPFQGNRGHLAELMRLQSILQLHNDNNSIFYYEVKGINRDVQNDLRKTDIDILVKDIHSDSEFWLEVKDADGPQEGRIQSQIIGMSMFLKANAKDALYEFYEKEFQDKKLRIALIKTLFYSLNYKELLTKINNSQFLQITDLEEIFSVIGELIEKQPLFKIFRSTQKFKKLLTAHKNFNKASQYNIGYIIDCYKELMVKKYLTDSVGLVSDEINELFDFFGEQTATISKYDTKDVTTYLFLNHKEISDDIDKSILVNFCETWFVKHLLLIHAQGYQKRTLGNNSKYIVYNLVFYHTQQKTKKKIIIAQKVNSVQGNLIISFMNLLNYINDSAFKDPMLCIRNIIESENLGLDIGDAKNETIINFLEKIIELDNGATDGTNPVISFTRYFCDYCYYMSSQGGNNVSAAKDKLKMLFKDYINL